MNKTTQDLSWACLPKEARNFIKSDTATAWQLAYARVFGEDNLTSDTEPEEMLHISRQSVIDKYAEIFWNKAPYFDDSPEALSCQACLNVLKSLFGDKCLPDKEPKFRKGEVVKSKSTNEILKIFANCSEIEKTSCLCVCQDGSVRDFPINDLESEQPSVQVEPKFKYNIGDLVTYKGKVKKVISRELDWSGAIMYTCSLPNGQSPLRFEEESLEPYIKPKQ